MPIKHNYYVYLYLDPKKPGTYSYADGTYQFEYEPFYVGKGSKYRHLSHIMEAKRIIKDNKSDSWIQQNYPNPIKFRKIRKILLDNKEPIILKLITSITNEQANEYEIDLISKIGKRTEKIGPLTNMTNGGDGGNTTGKRKWYNDGTKEKLYIEDTQPYNFILGKLTNIGDNHPLRKKGGHDDKAKKLISQKNKGRNIGKRHYTNGINEGLFVEGQYPTDWWLGRSNILKDKMKGIGNPHYGKKYFNNGSIEGHFFLGEQPPNWKTGRIEIDALKGENHPAYNTSYYTNGSEEGRFKQGEQPFGWANGRTTQYKEKMVTLTTGTCNGNFGKRKYINTKTRESQYFTKDTQPAGWLPSKKSKS